MPQKYKVLDTKTGQVRIIEGEGGPPTEQELEALFASGNKPAAPSGDARFGQLQAGGFTPEQSLSIIKRTPSMTAGTPPKQPAPMAVKTPSMTAEMNPLLKSIAQVTKPVRSALGTVGDVLARPGYGISNAALAGVEGKDISDAFWTGLKGEPHRMAEVLYKATGTAPSAAGEAIGLAGDIATDPLIALGGPIKTLATKAGKALAPTARAIKEVPVVNELLDKFRLFNRASFDPTTMKQLAAVGKPASSSEAFRDVLRLRRSMEQSATSRAANDLYTTLKEVEPEARFGPLQAAMERTAPQTPEIQAVADQLSSLTQRQGLAEQASGVGLTMRENYTPYVRSKGIENPFVAASHNPADRFTLPKRSASYEEAVEAGAEPDIAEAMSRRLIAGERAIARAGLLRETIDKFGHKAVTKKVGGTTLTNAPAGWRKVSIPGTIREITLEGGKTIRKIPPIIKELSKYHFPANVADELEKVFVVAKPGGALDHAWRTGMGVWKGYATAVNPSFHGRNQISNAFNMWLGGIKARELIPAHIEGARWFAGNKRFNIGNHSAEQIQKAMDDYAITSLSHGAFGDVPGLLEELQQVKARGRTANPLSNKFTLQVAGRAVGNAVETTSRVALYLNYLKKHAKDPDALEKAALHVKKYLFDYSELTPFEQKLRDYGVPFYTWLRKNIPLQAEALATQPGKYSAIGHIQRSGEAHAKETLGEKYVPIERRPEYIQTSQATALPVTTDTGNAVYYNLDLPMGDLNTITDPSKLLSSLGPVPKAVFEVGTNRNLHTMGEWIDENKGGWEQQVVAPEILAEIISRFPAAGRAVGSTAKLGKGKPQITVPAWLNYATRQIPWVTKMGKTTFENRPLPQGKLGPLRPDQWNALGTSFYTSSPADFLTNLLLSLKRAKIQAKPAIPAEVLKKELAKPEKKE